MASVAYMAVDFMKRQIIGDNIDQILKQAGSVCQSGEVEGVGSFSALTLKALDDCSAFGKTCLKVAFFAGTCNFFVPFLLGSLTGSVALGALLFGMLNHDIEEIAKRFSRLDQGDESLVPLFNQCQEVSSRVEFMVKSTTLIGLMPTSWVEKTGSFLGFIQKG